jgi:hypothetical protein
MGKPRILRDRPAPAPILLHMLNFRIVKLLDPLAAHRTRLAQLKE